MLKRARNQRQGLQACPPRSFLRGVRPRGGARKKEKKGTVSCKERSVPLQQRRARRVRGEGFQAEASCGPRAAGRLPGVKVRQKQQGGVCQLAGGKRTLMRPRVRKQQRQKRGGCFMASMAACEEYRRGERTWEGGCACSSRRQRPRRGGREVFRSRARRRDQPAQRRRRRPRRRRRRRRRSAPARRRAAARARRT